MRHLHWLGLAVGSVSALGCTGDVTEEADDPEALVDDENAWTDQPDDDDELELAPEGVSTLATFKHPGVLVNQAQLDFVKAKIAANAQPWKGAYDKLVASEYGKLSWQPKAREVVNCGPSSNPNEGCSDERRDAVAAYTHALLWYMTGKTAHAKKSIAILDAWAKKLKKHTGHNAPLQTGWAGCLFPAAAEIIRYTYADWDTASLDRVKKVFKDVYLPTVQKGNAGANGNWELIMTEATLNLAVFLDDKVAFEKGLALWRRRVPAYIYLTSDGDYPKAATSKHNTKAKIIKYWHNQTKFVDGLSQETCRDFGHTQWGIAAALNGAETAFQQGVDLYGEQSNRLRKGLEFHADYINGKSAPSWLCGGNLKLSSIPTWEIGYNHFHNRKDKNLPETKEYIDEKVRPKPDPVNYFIAWETLTHANLGDTGF